MKISFGGDISITEPDERKEYKGRLFWADSGNLIYSKIRAKQGSLAIVGPDVGKLAVSAEYPVYEVDATKVAPAYLSIVLRSRPFLRLLEGLSHGGSTKTRIPPEEFERQRIPLPTLPVQRKIVAAHEAARQYTAQAAAESQAWLNRVVDYLASERGIALPILVRKRHELADLILDRITDHGRKQIRKAAELLLGGDTERRLETTFDMPFEVAEQDYAPYRRYLGTFSFQKHAFDLIGDMGDEESQCAKKIDDHPNVKRWIRNLESTSSGGFSLPLAPGLFFPDFLIELNDGRTAIVEYKGGHLAERREELHKEDVGKLWAAQSGGKCAFERVVDRDWAKLEAALNAIASS